VYVLLAFIGVFMWGFLGSSLGLPNIVVLIGGLIIGPVIFSFRDPPSLNEKMKPVSPGQSLNKDGSPGRDSNNTNSNSQAASPASTQIKTQRPSSMAKENPPKQEMKKSSPWSEEFRLLEEYDSLVSQCHKEIIELNEELAEIFRKEVVANRKSARDIADRLISEHQRLTNPFESEELNAAFNEARKLGKKAEEEFKKVVNLLGEEDTDIKFTLAKIHEKYSPKEKPAGYAAPSVSFGQIKADLQEIDIRVFMPLWAGGYKIIDQEGVKHWVSTDAELKAYYLKQSIKDKNKKIDLADSASNEGSKNLSTNERTAFLDEEESTRASKANGLVKTPPSPDASKEEGMLLSHYLHSKGWKTEWFDPTGRIASIGTSVSGSFSGDNNCNFYEPFNCGFPPPKQLWHRKLFYDGITQIKVIEKERQGSSIFIDTLEVKVSGHEFKYGEWYTYRLADLSDRFCLEHLEHPGERFSFFVAGLTYVDSLYIK